MEIAEALVLGPDLLPHRGSDRDVHGLLSRYGAYRSRLRFHTADAANRCEAVVVSPCMLMTVVDVPGPDPFESQVSGQDLIEFHFRLSGRMVLAGGFGEVALEDPSLLLWYQPTGCDDVRERLGSPDRPRERWVSLYCDRGWLREMGSRETDSLLERLAPSPDSGDAPRFLVQPSIGAALPVLREIVAMHSAVSHPLAWLHASAKAMELLHVTLRDKSMLLDGGERRFRLTSRDRHLLGQAREILGREFVDPPSLSALARRIGLNTSKLCFGFRHEYGETTSEFVRRQRLAHAKTLLQETELQVREVARRCGYQHHSTFTAAFVRTFGMSPKGMRRIAEAARRTAA